MGPGTISGASPHETSRLLAVPSFVEECFTSPRACALAVASNLRGLVRLPPRHAAATHDTRGADKVCSRPGWCPIAQFKNARRSTSGVEGVRLTVEVRLAVRRSGSRSPHRILARASVWSRSGRVSIAQGVLDREADLRWGGVV